ncbi:MAG: HAD-IA family hydrolase [Halobacteriota archaeon]|nr:HAD-IA family hydrolase [Halobacteriota archaeon]
MKVDKTIIFDFDGTIANTLFTLTEIYNSIASRYNCRPVELRDAERLRNTRPQDFMRDYGVSHLKLPFLVMSTRRELHKRIDEVKPQADICNTLKELRMMGCTLGIVTSNSEKNISRFLEKNDLVGIFDFVDTGSHVFLKHRKIKKILKRREISKNSAIYVGDETRDVEAAKRAGIPVIAVSWGFNDIDALRRLDPDFAVEHPRDLIDILKSI